MTFDGTNLHFEPTEGWEHGDTVEVVLMYAEDESTCTVRPVACSFIVDTMPPMFANEYPYDSTVIHTDTATVSVDVGDVPAGVDPDAIDTANTSVFINGEEITGYSVNWDGLTFSFQGLTFESRDTVTVCINDLWDNPGYDYCEPNHIPEPYCWTFIVSIERIEPEIVSPLPYTSTACDPQPITIILHPGDAPIDTSSVVLTVDTVSYTLEHPYLELQQDTILVFTPPDSFWSSGSAVYVTLDSLADINGLQADSIPLSWEFVVDYIPPALVEEFPTTGENLEDSTAVITVSFFDGLSGVDLSHIMVVINDTLTLDLTSPAVWLVGDTIYFDPSVEDIYFEDNSNVQICIDSLADSPDYCGPNWGDYCWTFPVNYLGPTSEIISPAADVISSCDPQAINIAVVDPSGIDSSSVLLSVNGIYYTLDDAMLTFSAGTLQFVPPEGFFADGEWVTVSLDSVADIWGNVGQELPLTWTFRLDYSPPVLDIVTPGSLSTVVTPQPLIMFNLEDAISGVNADSMVVTVNGVYTFTLDSTALTFDGSSVSLELSETDIEFEDGDTVTVCVAGVVDNAEICGPNEMEEVCWEFYVNLSPPRSFIIEPTPESWSACYDQRIYIALSDSDGVDEATIRLTVNGDTYTIGPNLSYANDTLVFIPSLDWLNGETVSVCLDSVADNLGNGLPSPLCWEFFIDLTPPYGEMISPTDGDFVNDSVQIIQLVISDSLSGLDSSSVVVNVQGSDYAVGAPGVTLEDTILTFNPQEAGIVFSDYDTVEVCLTADDSPNYCGPNQLATCWHFYVRLSGPTGTVLYPFDGATSACRDQGVGILITDDDFGVNWESAEVSVQGSLFTYFSPEISVTGDTLFWQPTGEFSDNETVYVSLVNCEDSLGNSLQDTLTWSYVIDLTPPVIVSSNPAAEDTMPTIRPMVVLHLGDLISGVGTDSGRITLNDTLEYDLTNPALWWEGDSLIFSSDSAGITFSGGSRVELCVIAYDNPDYCPPNELDSCFVFYISPGGPYPEVIRPVNGRFSACSPESVIFRLSDDDGVIADSLQFMVIRGDGGADTSSFTGVDYPEIEWDGEVLTYIPTVNFADGESVDVVITQSYDSLFNPMDPAPFSWQFVMDMSPPEQIPVTGGAGYEYETRYPEIVLNLFDLLSGINEPSVVLNIDGTDYTIGSGLTFVNDTLYWNAEDVGVQFTGGDSVEVCLYAEDSPYYCGPNLLDSCWNVTIESGGPQAEVVRPFDGAYSACDTEYIVIALTDSESVVPSSIELVVQGDTLQVGDPGVSYGNDTLVYIPPVPFGDDELVEVELISAEDSLGNTLETPISFSFQMDREPPIVIPAGWDTGDTLSTRAPIFGFLLDDSLSGLDSLLTIHINSDEYDTSSPGLYWRGDTLYFDTSAEGYIFSGGDSIIVTLTAQDIPDYCGPNLIDTTFVVHILPGGPQASAIRPTDTTFSACVDESVMVLVEDEDGVVDTTILLQIVRGAGASDTLLLRVEDPELRFVSGETLIYIPTVPFAEAETVYVSVLEAEDILGNPLRLVESWSFVMDFSPPAILWWNVTPGGYVDSRNPEIRLALTDSLSGINPDSIQVSVDGNWFLIEEVGLSFDGETLVVNTEQLGFSWNGGDTFQICLDIIDTPDYCEPNPLDSCYYFIISPGGPIADIVEPLPESVSACLDQPIIVAISDTDGVDISTIQLEVNGVTYDISSGNLEFENDTLFWYPPGSVWLSDGIVDVSLISAADNLGNELSGAPIEWEFLLDLEGPRSVEVIPAVDTITYNWQQHSGLVVIDSLRGVDFTTAEIVIDSLFELGEITVNYGDDGVIVSGDTLWIYPALFDFSYTVEGSVFTGGYFVERDTVEIYITELNDSLPDYCDANEFAGGKTVRFYVADDDTLPPEFVNVGPDYMAEGFSFGVNGVLYDRSGIYDDDTGVSGQGIYLLWDTDGEVSIDYAGLIEMRIDSISGDTVYISSVLPIPEQTAGDSVYVEVYAYDDDYDFFLPDDRTQGVGSLIVDILAGPVASPIEPLPQTFTSCEDQQITIRLFDPLGIELASIRLEVEDSVYTIDSPYLSFENDSFLIFAPPELWVDGQEVNVRLLRADNTYGAPLSTPLDYYFTVDLTPPLFSMITPDRFMIRELNSAIEIGINDILSGINEDSLTLSVQHREYTLGEFLYQADDENNGRIIWDPTDFGISFQQGDTVYISVGACDIPDYCEANCSDRDYIFMVEPKVVCDVHPNPFTPNGDGFNDLAVFSYPYMFSEKAELIIYDRWNNRVFNKELEPISEFRDFERRGWYGRDNQNKNLTNGVYIYIIKVDDDIVCNGTIIIAR